MSISTPWTGRWSDGKTAGAKDVEIRLTENALEFRPTESSSALPVRWPYNEITAPHPVHKGDKSVLISARGHKDERLFIDDAAFAPEILSRAPSISNRAHTWGLLKWPLGIAASIVLFWALTFFNIISPANTLAFMMPETARDNLGKGVIKTIASNKPVCSTKEGDIALEKMITRLQPAVNSQTRIKVEVVDLGFVNAFAAPGDRIIISGKLIKEAANADEVAGVLAHEIGHAIERHPEANIIRVFGILTLMQLLTAGEAGAVGDIAFFLVQSGYSRAAEEEADAHAARILKNVTIDTRPLAGFFERLMNKKASKTASADDKADDKNKEDENKADKNADIPAEQKQPTATPKQKTEDKSFLKWISTHPATRSRIKLFRKSTISTNPPVLSNSEWQALQNICPEKTKDEDKEAEAEEQKTEEEAEEEPELDEI